MGFSDIIAGTMTWGSWGKGYTEKDMSDLIQHCLSEGITTFDHADIYGSYTTETEFGNAFKQSGVKREDVQFITKCGIQYLSENRDNTIKHYNLSKEYIIWSADQSLKNLKTDYLDLLLLHRPSPLMRGEEIAEAVEVLKRSGKIKNFGLSNFTPSQTDLIQKHTEISANQIQFSVSHFEDMWNGTLDHMTLHNIQPMAWSPLGIVFKEESERANRIKKLLFELIEKYRATADQLLLAWILRHPSGIKPVIGTTNKERVSNSVKALELTLELEDWFALLVASQGHKVD